MDTDEAYRRAGLLIPRDTSGRDLAGLLAQQRVAYDQPGTGYSGQAQPLPGNPTDRIHVPHNLYRRDQYHSESPSSTDRALSSGRTMGAYTAHLY